MHIAFNILLYGCHLNIHTGPQEHNHIANSKKPSQRTQKRKHTFDNQLGNRLNDTYSVQYTSNQIISQQASNKSSVDEPPEDQHGIKCTKMASKFVVTIKKDASTGQVTVGYNWLSASNKGKYLSKSLLELILTHYFDTETQHEQVQGIQLFILTEFTLNERTYRAHPRYKNESPWFDWVLIAWTMSSPIPQNDMNQNNAPDCITLSYKDTNAKKVTSKAMLIPAKLICIIEDKLGNISAIVQSCMKTRKKCLFLHIDGN